jgi:hypothetical protein
MRSAWLALLLLIPLAACAGRGAPEDAGVCWRAEGGDAVAPKFAVMARGVGNLETCAVLLEAAHMQGGAEVEGAYQGYFVFVDAKAITSGRHEGGLRYPIFQPPQRAEVDRDLTRLLK